MNLMITAMFLLGVAFGPLATIWSVNTLFQTDIAFTAMNWMAVMWLQIVVLAGTKR